VSLSLFIQLVAMPLAILAVMYGALNMGVKLRRKHHRDDGDTEGLGVVDGAVFGLMGLLLAFAFSGAASRFDERRMLVIKEANTIGTAWLRVDLLPEADQPEIRDKFREYVDARMATYLELKDEETIRDSLARSYVIQAELWKLAVSSAQRSPNTSPEIILLPAINEMFDVVNERSGHLMMHPPAAVYGLLVVVLILCGVLAGYRMGSSDRWSKLHRLSFVVILAITYYVIVDLEYPRLGVMRVDNYDRLIVQTRNSMN
jgi:hypothetical protein